MTTHTMPIITFPNTPAGILDYLVQRTADTIGEQVERAQVIVVGHVRRYEVQSKTVRRQHLAALKPWVIKQTGSEPHILFDAITVGVERWLKGTEEGPSLEIAYVHEASPAPGVGDIPPMFDAKDRGLIFLNRIPGDAPYAPYIPKSAYHLAEGETGIRNLIVADYDDEGNPISRNETAQIEEMIQAVEWYRDLPRQSADALQRALIQSIGHSNPRISRHAVRALARRKEPGADVVFRDTLRITADEALKIRLMLGLWILGEHADAVAQLERCFKENGKEAWLAQWDILPTLSEAGAPPETLYGPDPSKIRGD